MGAPRHDRFVLLDRDGVLNRDLPGSVLSADDLEPIEGSAEAVAWLNRAGFEVAVVTNQACVGRGELAPEELERIHLRLLETVAAAGGCIRAIHVCPHTDDDACDCRKPRPGLLRHAAAEHGLDLATTWFVGDDLRDVEAARAAGCRPALVRTGKGARVGPVEGVPVFDDLAAFAAWLVGD